MSRAGCGALLGALVCLTLTRLAAAPVQTLGEDAAFSAASAELLLAAFGAPWCQSLSRALAQALLCVWVCLSVCLSHCHGRRAGSYCRALSPHLADAERRLAAANTTVLIAEVDCERVPGVHPLSLSLSLSLSDLAVAGGDYAATCATH
eukprot:COSAG05_NODE_6552_length_939_cov_1.189286_1_plen_148_part_10